MKITDNTNYLLMPNKEKKIRILKPQERQNITKKIRILLQKDLPQITKKIRNLLQRNIRKIRNLLQRNIRKIRNLLQRNTKKRRRRKKNVKNTQFSLTRRLNGVQYFHAYLAEGICFKEEFQGLLRILKKLWNQMV